MKSERYPRVPGPGYQTSVLADILDPVVSSYTSFGDILVFSYAMRSIMSLYTANSYSDQFVLISVAAYPGNHRPPKICQFSNLLPNLQ
eukprot:3128406-Rhodomonas_salina.3